MKLLFLAPQPFFQERGTPIAVRLALEVLAERVALEESGEKTRIDLVTYHEGHHVVVPNVTIHRIQAPSFIKNVGPGISMKKLFCDVLFLWKTLGIAWSSRKDPYHLVHAVEESVFIALLLKRLFGIPYIYDMDSSLALQVTEKWRVLRAFRPILSALERMAIKSSIGVVPVCDTLAALAERHGSPGTYLLRDVSLLERKPDGADEAEALPHETLRSELGVPESALLILYVGNLERYQGVELLIAAFKEAAPRHPEAHLVIIGGRGEELDRLRATVRDEPELDRVHLVGPRPVAHLRHYILQADILASPRVTGNNTPMKIYSYLHSGKAIIATNIESHTQVLDEEVALLTAPDAKEMGEGLSKLLQNAKYRERIGRNGWMRAEGLYTFEIFRSRLNETYDAILGKVQNTGASGAPDRGVDASNSVRGTRAPRSRAG